MGLSSNSAASEALTLDQAVDHLARKLRRRKELEFEIFACEANGVDFEVKNQVMDALDMSKDHGLCLRLIQDGRLGFSYSTQLTPKALNEVFVQACENAKQSDRDPHRTFPEKSNSTYAELDLFDANFSTLTLEEKVEMAQQLEQAGFDADPRIEQTYGASYGDETSRLILLNHKGVEVEHRDTQFHIGLTAVAQGKAEEDAVSYGDSLFSHRFRDLRPQALGTAVGKRAVESLQAQSVSAGVYPVVFENRVVAEFLEILAESFSADAVQKNSSALKGKLGQAVFSPLIQIMDDATLPNQMGTSPFDGEGIPSRKNEIIKNGILQGFLYDSYTARKAGCSSTGNCVRDDIDDLPGVGTTNLYIPAGSASVDSMLQSVGQGVFVRELLGFHNADPISGDFSAGGSGFWIKNGGLAHPIRDFTVAGNLLELFQNVQMLASDFRFSGSFGAPSLAAKSLPIGGED